MRWLFLLAGPIIWAIHFAAAYGIASISIQSEGSVSNTARIIIVAISAVLIVVAITCTLPRRSDSSLVGFLNAVRVTGLVVTIVAIVWQTLPLTLS